MGVGVIKSTTFNKSHLAYFSHFDKSPSSLLRIISRGQFQVVYVTLEFGALQRTAS
jgi:hypothetical protein